MAPDLAFSLKNTLPSQLLLKPLGIVMKFGTKKDHVV
jgi:hypothetical protein